MSPEPNTESPTRTRLRFAEFEKTQFPDGRCRVRVVLEWVEGVSWVGEVEGTQTLEGETRAAATAALDAAQQATDGQLRLELRGTKAVRVFDSWVVIVSARGHTDDEDYSLVGSYACDDSQTAHGAALAALAATNRVMERYVAPITRRRA